MVRPVGLHGSAGLSFVRACSVSLRETSYGVRPVPVRCQFYYARPVPLQSGDCVILGDYKSTLRLCQTKKIPEASKRGVKKFQNEKIYPILFQEPGLFQVLFQESTLVEQDKALKNNEKTRFCSMFQDFRKMGADWAAYHLIRKCKFDRRKN